MNTDSYVNTSGLKEIANNISTKREEIASLYKDSIVSIINESKDAISVSGINYDDFITKFGNTFQTLDERLASLSDILVNQIIPNYDDLNVNIKNAFNKEFAEEMNNILRNL